MEEITQNTDVRDPPNNQTIQHQNNQQDEARNHRQTYINPPLRVLPGINMQTEFRPQPTVTFLLVGRQGLHSTLIQPFAQPLLSPSP